MRRPDWLAALSEHFEKLNRRKFNLFKRQQWRQLVTDELLHIFATLVHQPVNLGHIPSLRVSKVSSVRLR